MGELWIAFAYRGGRLAWPSPVDLKLLIDGIVRQTTVLIAQLSTSSGIRAPLAHVADQVFLELAREIEAQGVAAQGRGRHVRHGAAHLSEEDAAR